MISTPTRGAVQPCSTSRKLGQPQGLPLTDGSNGAHGAGGELELSARVQPQPNISWERSSPGHSCGAAQSIPREGDEMGRSDCVWLGAEPTAAQVEGKKKQGEGQMTQTDFHEASVLPLEKDATLYKQEHVRSMHLLN